MVGQEDGVWAWGCCAKRSHMKKTVLQRASKLRKSILNKKIALAVHWASRGARKNPRMLLFSYRRIPPTCIDMGIRPNVDGYLFVCYVFEIHFIRRYWVV